MKQLYKPNRLSSDWMGWLQFTQILYILHPCPSVTMHCPHPWLHISIKRPPRNIDKVPKYQGPHEEAKSSDDTPRITISLPSKKISSNFGEFDFRQSLEKVCIRKDIETKWTKTSTFSRKGCFSLRRDSLWTAYWHRRIHRWWLKWPAWPRKPCDMPTCHVKSVQKMGASVLLRHSWA